MLRIGLTGGIGAGKSAVAARLSELGAVIVDSDVLAREVVAAGTPGLAAVVAEFGEEILARDGSLDRAKLGAIVFGDPERRAALNAIVHPLVGERSAALVAAAPPDTVVVNDIPLLVENGLGAAFHLVIVVEAPEVARVERLARTRGMTAGESAARMAAQATDGQRRGAADVVLVNDGTLDELHAAVDALWHGRLAPFATNLATGRAPAPPTEPVPYRPEWAAEFERLAGRLRLALGPWAPVIGHVGDTAVPGRAALDLLHLRVQVADQPPAEALAQAGWIAAAGSVAADGVAADGVAAEFADPGRPAVLSLCRAG